MPQPDGNHVITPLYELICQPLRAGLDVHLTDAAVEYAGYLQPDPSTTRKPWPDDLDGEPRESTGYRGADAEPSVCDR